METLARECFWKIAKQLEALNIKIDSWAKDAIMKELMIYGLRARTEGQHNCLSEMVKGLKWVPLKDATKN